MSNNFIAFGDRLRQIRKEKGLSQEEFAKILGTSKQVLSRYETNQRAPKITIASEYAEKLGVTLDYMLGDTAEEATFYELCPETKDKPFYKIFMDIMQKMNLNIPEMARVANITDKQVRTIITRHLKDAPLPLALKLTDNLGIPLEVWTGDMIYTPAELSTEAREVALAYDRADTKSRNIARSALDLELIKVKEKSKLP